MNSKLSVIKLPKECESKLRTLLMLGFSVLMAV